MKYFLATASKMKILVFSLWKGPVLYGKYVIPNAFCGAIHLLVVKALRIKHWRIVSHPMYSFSYQREQ